jgi:hypothetical protein
VKHVDCDGKVSGINDAENSGLISDSQLFDSFTNPRQGFEIVRLLSPLHQLQLISRIMARVFRKLT